MDMSGKKCCLVRMAGGLTIPDGSSLTAFFYDSEKNLTGSQTIGSDGMGGSLGGSFTYVAFSLSGTELSETVDDCFDMFYICHPHYKDLYKKYKK